MQLNFENFNFQIKSDNNGRKIIYDVIRKKYVVLTPEEWVRQHLVHTLIQKGWSSGRLSVERTLPKSSKRYDLIYYDAHGVPSMLAECKAPSIPIDQNTLDQVVDYIHLLDVPVVLLTNGLDHMYVLRTASELKIFHQIPVYSEIKNVFLP